MAAYGGRLRAVFDAEAWAEDMAATTPAGRLVADEARRRFDAGGVPVEELRRCDPEGRDGTRLPGCVKVYLPPPAGRFGMVFRLTRDPSKRPVLVLVAFGVRHHPRGSRALTLYQRAHRRLWKHRR